MEDVEAVEHKKVTDRYREVAQDETEPADEPEPAEPEPAPEDDEEDC